MDVAADANIILNDPRMQGNAFHNLLAYPRKTDSRLVLSKIVFDEIVARYPDRLRAAVHKATGTVGTLRHLFFDGTIKVPEIDVPKQTKKLRQKLLKPSPHVRGSLVVKNFAKIKIEEVAKRGIDRIPPANGTGEQLRDVMHWLMILAHAQSSGREIAFISGDEHFRKGKICIPGYAKTCYGKEGELPSHRIVQAIDAASREIDLLTQSVPELQEGKKHDQAAHPAKADKGHP